MSQVGMLFAHAVLLVSIGSVIVIFGMMLWEVPRGTMRLHPRPSGERRLERARSGR